MILQANIGAGMSEKTFFFNYYFFINLEVPHTGMHVDPASLYS